MDGVIYIENFMENSLKLFNSLKRNIVWDDRMKARKTSSFGRAYNYSQMHYPFQDFTEDLEELLNRIENQLEFRPNNCLINYYLDGSSKMGFHSDKVEDLESGTGVAIISLGEPRILRFRNIKNQTITQDFILPSGSLIYMTNEVQNKWKHAIPKSDTNKGRMSLTFRKIRD